MIMETVKPVCAEHAKVERQRKGLNKAAHRSMIEAAVILQSVTLEPLVRQPRLHETFTDQPSEIRTPGPELGCLSRMHISAPAIIVKPE